MKPSLLFESAPYIAVTVLAGVLAIRYLLSRRRILDLSSRISEGWKVFGGSKLWRLSLTLLLLGHLAGLLFPTGIMFWNSVPIRLYLLEGFAFIVGVLALLCWARLVWNYLEISTGPFLSEVMDTVFLALLFTGMVSGTLMAAIYRWGSSWGTAILTPYILTVFRGSPITEFAAEMPFLVQLHVFSFFAALAVVPFTRLGTALVLALQRALGFFGKPILALAEAMEAWLSRHNPAGWIWPEED